jgi:hypothetical protein
MRGRFVIGPALQSVVVPTFDASYLLQIFRDPVRSE